MAEHERMLFLEIPYEKWKTSQLICRQISQEWNSQIRKSLQEEPMDVEGNCKKNLILC